MESTASQDRKSVTREMIDKIWVAQGSGPVKRIKQALEAWSTLLFG